MGLVRAGTAGPPSASAAPRTVLGPELDQWLAAGGDEGRRPGCGPGCGRGSGWQLTLAPAGCPGDGALLPLTFLPQKLQVAPLRTIQNHR